MHPLVQEFMTLFEGLTGAYGTYDVDKHGSEVKQKGKAATIKQTLTTEQWNRHLLGIQRLGVIPINCDSLVRFGAIDIDQYPLDHKKLNKLILDLSLPLIVCRSKSGGAHLYMFMSAFIEAQLMQDKLKEFAAALGYGNCEVFPKQTKIITERGDLGQWINMPYFDSHKSMVYGFNEYGDPMTPEAFVKRAAMMLVTPERLATITISIPEKLPDGPPCLQVLVTDGFPEGTRNNGLFNLGVYCRKAYGDNWKQYLEEFNQKFLTPPLSASEVLGLIKSLDKKDYNYTCKSAPIAAHCNAPKCKGCKFGVGFDIGMPKFGTLTKVLTEPPIWFLDVEGGGRVELSTEELQNPIGFQRRCMDALNIMPIVPKREHWTAMVQGLMSDVHIVEVPSEATARGLLLSHLQDFCTSRVQAKQFQELLLGKPWTNEGFHFFRLKDFLAYLERVRFKEYKMSMIALQMREFGCDKKFFTIHGTGVNCYKIKEFKKIDSGFEVPIVKKPEVM